MSKLIEVLVKQLLKKSSVWIAAVGVVLLAHAPARADVLYRWDTAGATERFNNSEGVETEDNWVANAFVVVDGGTRLVSLEYPLGETFVNRPATVAIYRGVDISDPSAGGGLVLLQFTDATITGERGTAVTLAFPPMDFLVGDVFYAALLIPGVTGDLFPFLNQGTTPQGHSFFDVGPAQGAAYCLFVTTNARVLGATHPVVGADVQSPGNLFLRVNATATP